MFRPRDPAGLLAEIESMLPNSGKRLQCFIHVFAAGLPAVLGICWLDLMLSSKVSMGARVWILENIASLLVTSSRLPGCFSLIVCRNGAIQLISRQFYLSGKLGGGDA